MPPPSEVTTAGKTYGYDWRSGNTKVLGTRHMTSRNPEAVDSDTNQGQLSLYNTFMKRVWQSWGHNTDAPQRLFNLKFLLHIIA